MAFGSPWSPRLAFHDDYERKARELEVFLDRPRKQEGREDELQLGFVLKEVRFDNDNFGSHGWSQRDLQPRAPGRPAPTPAETSPATSAGALPPISPRDAGRRGLDSSPPLYSGGAGKLQPERRSPRIRRDWLPYETHGISHVYDKLGTLVAHGHDDQEDDFLLRLNIRRLEELQKRHI
eukprot:gb/GFBE01001501.1/.p1 GENE.gb/GFBE01001501.1/~~gb/GFBE01001501.1/.p1  ORF type:complete len:179 (+),score=26.27 gb/GFBE01001501.1/:1-537(+)